MAKGVTTPNQKSRNAPREFLPPTFTAVDERHFESEIKRIDTTLADEKKNREKFETRIEKSVNDLRNEVNARFDKMEENVDSRFEKMDGKINELRRESNTHFMWMMSLLIGAILIPIALQYFAK